MIERHVFPEGEEPVVLTEISALCSAGKHAPECSGIRTFEDGETVFCVCRCHQVPHAS